MITVQQLVARVSAPDTVKRVDRLRRLDLRRALPWILLSGLLLAALVTVALRANAYGITYDEPQQDWVGLNFLKWYTTFGQYTYYLTGFPAIQYVPEHGGIFDALVAAVQHALPFLNHWYVRHLLTALCGWLGLVAIALCGYELGGGWVAFLAALGLWLYPRYYGAIYNNPKDVPAAVAMTFLLWATLLLIKHWDTDKRPLRYGLLVGVALGVACAIRVNAIIWWAILAVLLAGWWLAHVQEVRSTRRFRAVLLRQFGVAAVMAVSWMLSMMALWPYIFVNPIGNLINAIEVISRYPYIAHVPLNGVIYLSTQLPWYYAPEWLGIGSPPALILLALLGIGILLAAWVRTRTINAQLATVLLACIAPLLAIIVLHSVLYDTLRQFLFVVPPIILLAAFGLVRAFTWLMTHQRPAPRVAAVALAVLAFGSYVLVTLDMVSLSPYEYVYFSPIVGGLSGASNGFPTDYWAECSRQSAEWLAQNYSKYTTNPSPVVRGPTPDPRIITPFLPHNMRVVNSNVTPDFFIGFMRGNNVDQYSTYAVKYVVEVQNVPLCYVMANPALNAQPTNQSG